MIRRMTPGSNLLLYLLIVLFAAFVGAVILVCVMTFDQTAGYFPICSVMALVGVLVAAMAYSLSGSAFFDLGLSLGASRAQLIRRQLGLSALLCASGTALAVLIFFVELWLEPMIFGVGRADGDGLAIWRFVANEAPLFAGCLAGGTVGLWLLSVIYTGLAMRFGQKVNMAWILFYLVTFFGRGALHQLSKVLPLRFDLHIPTVFWGIAALVVLVAGFVYALQVMRHRAVSL